MSVKVVFDCNLWWNTPLQKIAITHGNQVLPWVFFHVESTIDYFVGFSLIVLGFKTQGIGTLGYPE